MKLRSGFRYTIVANTQKEINEFMREVERKATAMVVDRIGKVKKADRTHANWFYLFTPTVSVLLNVLNETNFEACANGYGIKELHTYRSDGTKVVNTAI